MREIGEALRLLFGKLSEFLDVFDLSFLISGGAALLALAYVGWGLGLKLPPGPTEPAVMALGLMGILLAYVCGLVCFATGRALRRRVASGTTPWYSGAGRTSDETRLDPVVQAHGLQAVERFAGYFDDKGRASGYLYVRLWAELRHDPRRAASMTLLNHYWKLAATYDGLAATALLWLAVLLGAAFGAFPAAPAVPLAVTLGASAVALLACAACSNEAGRYEHYQLEELAASIAAEPPPPQFPPYWDAATPLPPLSSLRR